MRPGYHFNNLDFNKYEAENAVPSERGTPFQVVRKIAADDEAVRWTGDGFLEVGSALSKSHMHSNQLHVFREILA